MISCTILQPSYIPWRGYFHQIQKSTFFVFYDDVQYDKRGWRNRNRIKTPDGPIWLTIPVHSRGAQTQHIPINEIRICWDKRWNEEHWRTIEYAYHHLPNFDQFAPILQAHYEQKPEYLANFTIDLTIEISRLLGIKDTNFIRSSLLNVDGRKTDRLINILLLLGATHYISGPSARGYLEEDKFKSAGIELEYMDYNYPEYPQPFPPFDPQISILDLLFATGQEAHKYIYSKVKA